MNFWTIFLVSMENFLGFLCIFRTIDVTWSRTFATETHKREDSSQRILGASSYKAECVHG
jgi:hypothetical protein